MKVVAVVLAGGSGLRFSDIKDALPKQFHKIGDKTLLELTLDKFESNKNISSILVVINKKWLDFANEIIENAGYKKVISVLGGGKTRFDSSSIALDYLANEHEDTEKVLIHDAVRPFVSENIINSVIKALEKADAVEPILMATDTLVKLDRFGVPSTLDRSSIGIVQTPQGFNFNVIYNAFAIAKIYLNSSSKSNRVSNETKSPTDDMSVIEEFSPRSIRTAVKGESQNKKITFKSDLNIKNDGDEV